MERARAATRVAIVDPAEIWATGVALVVRSCGFEHVGTWSNPHRAIAAFASEPPHILIVAAALAHKFFGTSIFDEGERPAIIIVIEPGARLSWREIRGLPFTGILVRDTPMDIAGACIKSIAARHSWIDPRVVRAMPEAARAHRQNWGCLSTRELEVAGLAAEGFSNKRIAKQLNLSDGTVKMHMHHILAKLHVASRTELGRTEMPEAPHRSESALQPPQRG